MPIALVEKKYVFEPSTFDPPEQDQYEYWAYTFDIDGRHYDVRRFATPQTRHTSSRPSATPMNRH